MANRTFLIVVSVLLAIIALSSLAIWNSYVELTTLTVEAEAQ